MRENRIGNLAGPESSWMGEEGWKNKGYPTMKYTWGTLATVVTAGTFAMESSTLAHTSIMGTTTTKQVGTWIYSGFSFGVGTYNTYLPDNTWGNEIGKGVDIYDFYRFRNPFGIMNYGFRGIDYYQSQNKK